MAKKSIISITVADNGAVEFSVDGAGAFTVDPAWLSEDIRSRALVHGLVQKISDAAAMPKADLPADPIEAAKLKLSAMKAVADRLTDGEWSKNRGDGSGPVSGIIYRAFEAWAIGQAKAKKSPAPAVETLRARYDAMDRGTQLALRNVPGIAAEIERIKAERGAGSAKAIDATALLADLGID